MLICEYFYFTKKLHKLCLIDICIRHYSTQQKAFYWWAHCEFLANRIYANLIYLLLLADHIDGKACETVVGDMKTLLHRDMLENDKITQGIVKDIKELFVSEVFDPGIDKNLKKELFVLEVFDPGGKIN